MTTLRQKIIRLAFQKEGLRDYLLPLVVPEESFASKKASTWKVNISLTSKRKARAFMREQLMEHGGLDKLLPSFDDNYDLLKGKLQNSFDIPRVQMPVIEPSDMKEFKKKLEAGKIDLLKDWAKHKDFELEKLKCRPNEDSSISIGLRPEDPEGVWTSLPAEKLVPTQSQIWLDKVAKNIKKQGPVTKESDSLESPIITSKEGYILDGHHRYASTMLSSPSLRMEVLYIPIGIETLIKLGKAYSDSVGNNPKG